MIQVYGSIQNLSGTRVRPGGSHRVSRPGGRITHTRIFQIIRIEFRIIRGKILSDNRIFKADSFKSSLPLLYTFFDVFTPSFRESVIHVEHDRFYRLYQLSPLIRFHVRRLQSPTVSKITRLYTGTVTRKFRTTSHEDSDTRIGVTGTHRLFRQQDNTPGHYRIERSLINIIVTLIAYADNITQ